MSSYPSLVSDVCEILRSLLFPFELCAPYVPRLTSPFMSCLQFPGAIFVGVSSILYMFQGFLGIQPNNNLLS